MLPLPVCGGILPHSSGSLDGIAFALIPVVLRHSLVALPGRGLPVLCLGPTAQMDLAQESDPGSSGWSLIGFHCPVWRSQLSSGAKCQEKCCGRVVVFAETRGAQECLGKALVLLAREPWVGSLSP